MGKTVTLLLGSRPGQLCCTHVQLLVHLWLWVPWCLTSPGHHTTYSKTYFNNKSSLICLCTYVYIFKKDFVSLPRGNILARYVAYVSLNTSRLSRRQISATGFCGKPLGRYCLPNKLIEFILQLKLQRFKPVWIRATHCSTTFCRRDNFFDKKSSCDVLQ